MAGKYDGLRMRLERHSGATATLSLADIDQIVGGLPLSARTHRAWWANERRPGHVQCEAWTSAGFVVTKVASDHIVFSRVPRRAQSLEVVGVDGDGTRVLGRLDLRDGLAVADDGARWLIDEFTAVLPDGDTPRRVRPEHGEAFLVGCWVSLRGTHTWGELVSSDGRRLTREEGLALAASLAGVGDRLESDPGAGRPMSA